MTGQTGAAHARGRPRLILNSLPKSGTNLLSRVFSELPGYSRSGTALTYATAEGHEDDSSGLFVGVSTPRGIQRDYFATLMRDLEPGHYHVGHLPYSQEARDIFNELGFRMIVILRDPRAVVCSFVHFILSRKEHVLYPSFADEPRPEARIELAIRGFPPSPRSSNLGLLPIADCFKSVADWTSWPGALAVSFEELIGPRGGGTVEDQAKVLHRMLEHVGYASGEVDTRALGGSLFSETSITFRKGQIDEWRNEFTADLEACFDKYAGAALQDYRSLFAKVLNKPSGN